MFMFSGNSRSHLEPFLNHGREARMATLRSDRVARARCAPIGTSALLHVGHVIVDSGG